MGYRNCIRLIPPQVKFNKFLLTLSENMHEQVLCRFTGGLRLVAKKVVAAGL